MARRAAEYGIGAGPVTVDMPAVMARVAPDRRRGARRVRSTGWRGTPGLHRHRGPRPARPARARSRSATRRLAAARIFLNVGARAAVPRSARCPRRADPDQHDDLLALDALPAAPGGGRRRLYRPRVRAELPAVRRRGHRGREGAAADRARGPRRLRGDPRSPRGRGRPRPHRGRVHPLRAASGGAAVGVDCATARRRRWRATCCSPWAGSPTPTTSGSRPPASRPTSAASSSSTTSWRPACRGSGRSASATAAAPSPTPPTTTSRSSAANLLDGGDRKVTDRLPAYALFTDPPLGRVGLTETEARASGRRVLVGKRPMTRVSRAVEKGETHGLHQGRRRCRHARDPRRGDPRRREATRRSTPCSISCTPAPRSTTLHPRRAHPSHRRRAPAHRLRRDAACGMMPARPSR